MWTHVQFAWWWYLELRRDKDVICNMRFRPNLGLGWIVIVLMSVQSIEEDLWISMGTSIFEKVEGLIAVTGIMQTNKAMMSSIEEWSIEQTHHGAAKYNWSFMHHGTVMTEGIHFEYTIWASVIVLIALIHSEHVFAYITEVLRAAIRWSRQQTRRARSHCNQMNESI